MGIRQKGATPKSGQGNCFYIHQSHLPRFHSPAFCSYLSRNCIPAVVSEEQKECCGRARTTTHPDKVIFLFTRHGRPCRFSVLALSSITFFSSWIVSELPFLLILPSICSICSSLVSFSVWLSDLPFFILTVTLYDEIRFKALSSFHFFMRDHLYFNVTHVRSGIDSASLEKTLMSQP